MAFRLFFLLLTISKCCVIFANFHADSTLPLFRLQDTEGYSDFCISEQGQWVVAADDYGFLNIWKGRSTPYAKLQAGHFQGILTFGICSDSLELITIGSDGHMHIFDLKAAKRKYRIPIAEATYASIHSSGKYAAVVGSKGNLIVYDLTKAKINPDNCTAFTIMANPKVPLPFAFSDKPDKIVVIAPNKSVWLRDIQDTSFSKLVQNENRFVQEVHFIGPALVMIKGYATGYTSTGHTGSPAADSRTFMYDTEAGQYVDRDKILSSQVFPSLKISEIKGSGNLLAASSAFKYILVDSPARDIEFWETESYIGSL